METITASDFLACVTEQSVFNSHLVQDLAEAVQFGQFYKVEPCNICNPPGRLWWHRIQVQSSAT